MMRKVTGASLFQYIIILSCVAVAIIPAFFGLGQNLFNQLSGFYNVVGNVNENMDVNSDPVKLDIVSNNVQAGDLGGTASSPVMSCAKDTCAIDYGTLVLNGVPANFSEVVETTGAAGGTEKVLSLLEQVAEQKKDDPATTEQELQDLNKLIACGREIVEIEKIYDNFMATFQDDVNGIVADRNSIDYYNILKASQTSYINEVDKTEWPVNISDYVTRTYDFTDEFIEQKKLIEQKYSDMQKLRGSTKLTMPIEGQDVTLKGAMDLYMMLNPSAVIHVTDDGNVDLMASKTAFNTSKDMQDYLDGTINIEAYKGDLSGLPDSVLNTGYFTTSPVSFFLQQLDDVLVSSNDPTVKELTSTLSDEVLKLSQRASESYLTVNNYIWSGKDTYSDFEKLKDPAAETTRLDLMIICVSNGGEFDSTSNDCK
ncbi:MAG: hypothetical protein AB7V50_09685 [Vampirovibrionia bacterium]